MTNPADNCVDASTLLYEMGRHLQTVALVMRKHRIASAVGVCEACGRTALCEIPVFGPRCDIAVRQWRVVRRSMQNFLGFDQDGDRPRVIGRAPVPPSKH